jgi:hypothetical protein
MSYIESPPAGGQKINVQIKFNQCTAPCCHQSFRPNMNEKKLRIMLVGRCDLHIIASFDFQMVTGKPNRHRFSRVLSLNSDGGRHILVGSIWKRLF